MQMEEVEISEDSSIFCCSRFLERSRVAWVCHDAAEIRRTARRSTGGRRDVSAPGGAERQQGDHEVSAGHHPPAAILYVRHLGCCWTRTPTCSWCRRRARRRCTWPPSPATTRQRRWSSPTWLRLLVRKKSANMWTRGRTWVIYMKSSCQLCKIHRIWISLYGLPLSDVIHRKQTFSRWKKYPVLFRKIPLSLPGTFISKTTWQIREVNNMCILFKF